MKKSKLIGIHEDLKLDYEKKKKLRKNLGSNIKITDKHHALMKIKVSDINEVIAEQNLNKTDYLVFFLASYRTKADIERYKLKEDLGTEADEIKFKPTLLVAGERNRIIGPVYYDIALVKPPPFDNETTDPS